jgi:hypothetical protein
MPELTEEGKRLVAEIAVRHDVSPDSVRKLLVALAAGGGTQAQFDIAELGGMGQWSPGGMVMIGDMFNHGLKAKVDALGTELAALLRTASPFAAPRGGARAARGDDWWPAELGRPTSTGAQNDMRYAFFPHARRLAVEENGRVTVYDTGGHQLSGFGQQQSGRGSFSFAGQHGPVRLSDLQVVGGGRDEECPEQADAPHTSRARPECDAADQADAPREAPAPPRAAPRHGDDVLGKLEQLAALRDRGIVTDAEFAEKKAELLRRL